MTKDSLAFMTNPHIRMGLASFVSGFDPKKLQAKIALDTNLARGFKSFNQEIMAENDVLDYLGGEFALSLG